MVYTKCQDCGKNTFEGSKYCFPCASKRHVNDENEEIEDQWFLVRVCEYKKGILKGKCKYYHNNGNLYVVGNYNGGTLPWGYSRGFGSDNWIHYTHKERGIKDGEWITYFENRRIKTKGKYKDNIKDGKWVTYYENGQLELEEIYLNGIIKDGKWICYYENGKINTKGKYKDGFKDGEWITYYENGKINTKGKYKDGMKDGEWITRFKNGKLKSKINYKYNYVHGKSLYYLENGNLDRELNYKYGESHGKFIFYENDNYSQ